MFRRRRCRRCRVEFQLRGEERQAHTHTRSREGRQHRAGKHIKSGLESIKAVCVCVCKSASRSSLLIVFVRKVY